MSARCAQCGLKVESTSATCPNCGGELAASAPATASRNLIVGYFQTLLEALTRPVTFFGKLPLRGGLARPFAFALVTHWLGEAGSLLWQQSFGSVAQDFWKRVLKYASEDTPYGSSSAIPWSRLVPEQNFFDQWFWTTGAVVADPFFSLLKLSGMAAIYFLGARILVTPGRAGAPSEITYESTARILAYAWAGTILMALPFVGSGLATFVVLVLFILGVRSAFRVSTGRAIAIGLFPMIVSWLMLLLMFAVVFLLIGKFLMPFLTTG